MLQHKSTDHEPGGSGTAGPWPPSHVSVVNPILRIPGRQSESAHTYHIHMISYLKKRSSS